MTSKNQIDNKNTGKLIPPPPLAKILFAMGQMDEAMVTGGNYPHRLRLWYVLEWDYI